MTDRTLELYSEDDERGTRNVWLRLTEDGVLILEGQDLGRQVSDFFGGEVSEYEWGWSLPADQLHVLHDSLRVDNRVDNPPADLLETVASSLRRLDTNGMQECFKDAGAEFWSRVGE